VAVESQRARPRVGRYANVAMTLNWAPDTLPPGASAEPVVLPTPDRAATSGVLYRPAAGERAVVCITHPRVDCAAHYLIPPLLRAGHAVWAQRSRNVNNDLSTVHEQLLIDLAVAHAYLVQRGLERFFLLGNSGGASIYCLYVQQAGLPPERRLRDAPSGLPVDLTLSMPMPAGLILLAPHAGQGELLLHCIDPAVRDEDDPLSTVADLDLFAPENGFREPPESSEYATAFLERYRAAQRERVARIDARARALLEQRAAARAEARATGSTAARRRALSPAYVVVHRTDADPRTVDLRLDPSDRDYGSIFGRRPDVTNYGTVGFGRLTTPDAWLSTWSGLSSRAAIRLTGPDVRIPTLVVAYTADNSVFPGDVDGIRRSLGSSDDASFVRVLGDHYGYLPGSEDRAGGREAAEAIAAWLDERT
jgi:hypothetical protein